MSDEQQTETDESEMFAPVPLPVVRLAALSPSSYLVDAWCEIYLLWFAAGGKGPVAISQNSLSKAMNCGKNQLGEALGELVEAGWLARYRVKTGGKYMYLPLRRRTVPGEGTLADQTESDRPRRGDGTVPSEGTVNRKPSPEKGHIKRVKNIKRGGGTDTVDSPAAGGAGIPPNESIEDKTEYPDHCPDHRFNPNPPPCGGCAKVRTANQQRAQRDDRLQKLEADRKRTAALQLEIRNCGMCDGDGYVNGIVCHHKPDQGDINSRGAAMVRATVRQETAASKGVESLSKLGDTLRNLKGTP